MIIKSISKKGGTMKLINYLFKDRDKLENEHFLPMVVKHNLTGHDRARWTKQLEFNHSLLKVKSKSNNVLIHTVLSFHPKERALLNTKILKDFAKEFINLSGKDRMHLVTAHVEKTDHCHLHCISSNATFLTGKSSRISKKQFQEFKIAMEAFQKQKYPQLKYSLVQGNSRKDRKAERSSIRQTDKSKLTKLLEGNFSKAQNFDSLIELLKTNGYDPYTRNGQIAGLKNEAGRKFRFKTVGIEKKQIEELEARGVEQMRELDELQNLRDSSISNARENTGRDRFEDKDEEIEQEEAQEMENELEQDDDYGR